MITRVRIENFRCLESVEFAPTQLCALLGENNTGKSSVLQAIHAVLGKTWSRVSDFSADDHTDCDSDLDLVVELDFDPPPTYQKFKYGPAVDIPTLRFTHTKYKRTTESAQAGDPRLLSECLSANGGPVQVPARAPRKGERTPFQPLVNVPGGVKEQVSSICVGTARRLYGQLPTSRNSLLRRLLQDVDDAVKTTVAEDDEEGRTVGDIFLERLHDALDTLRVPEFVELEELLRDRAIENLGMTADEGEERFNLYFGLGDTFEFFKAMRIMVEEYDHLRDALHLGDGAQNAIVLAVFQAYEQLRRSGAIFLIDEPEMYLHPHRCRLFYSTLRRLSESNQIIYTTHSPYFVTVPEYEEIRLIQVDDSGRASLRASDLEPSTGLREKIRKELDPERNELFFAKHVILVEGDTEKLALPEYASRLSVDLDRLGISIVEVGGKRSLDSFAAIVRSFDIPCTIVFDTDSSDFGQNQREQEEAYNDGLRGLADNTTTVVEFNPRYEAVLRTTCGEEAYQALTSKYGGTSKAIRARRIAEDDSTPIPDQVSDLLERAAGAT